MKFRNLIILAIVLLAAAPMYAQGGAATSSPAVPKAFAMAIASGLCGLGQGRAVAGAAEAFARNPAAKASIQLALLLGLAFIESLALFTLILSF